MKKQAAPLIALMGLALLLAHGPQHAASIYHAEDVLLSWNLQEEPIDPVLQRMRTILVDNKPKLTLVGRPVLAPKDAAPGSPPGRWVKVTVIAGNFSFEIANL